MNEVRIDMGACCATINAPKRVARITVCGAVNFDITDTMAFTRPTEEQIKNLKDMLCIDVQLFDEAE